MFGVVIPNRYHDIIQPLIASIHNHIRHPRPEIVIVADNHNRDYGFRRIDYNEQEFVFAKSANLGINAMPNKDIILLNDDCRLLEDEFFTKLAWLARKSPMTGMLSPLIVGCVGTAAQRYHEKNLYWDSDEAFKPIRDPEFLCFPCIYLRRQMLDQIGLLNERIKVYGHDDEDLCRRAHKAGWQTVVTSVAKIQHGDGSDLLSEGRGISWSMSFARRKPLPGQRPRKTVKPAPAKIIT